MSVTVACSCPIEGCRFNKILYADIVFLKNHIRQHDYNDKLETAYNLGIIQYITERRAPQWLDEKLADYGRGRI